MSERKNTSMKYVKHTPQFTTKHSGVHSLLSLFIPHIGKFA